MRVEPDDRASPANPQTVKPPSVGLGPDEVAPLSQVANDLINLPFDRYQLIRVIGEGAMGTVYQARQHDPARTVAVKVMKTRHASAAAEARFLQESQLLATLNHPHVAQLYDAGIHRHGVLAIPFSVMELVRGASSITAFSRAQRLNTRQRIELFLQVCAGVRHVHEAGIVHCDLKPANILVNDQGQVKVIDFGVARTMQLDESGGTIWSDASMIFGTPQYMSPEQAKGHDLEIGARSDVYALGVVLYELLCSRVPYNVDRTSAITAARSILEAEPLPPRKIDRSLRGDIEKILYRSLAKETDRRYPSVLALEQDLTRLLAGEPITEGAGSEWVYRTRRRSERWLARHRLFATAVTLLIGTAVCALIATAIGERGAGLKYDLFLDRFVHHTPSAPLKHVVIAQITANTNFPALSRPNDPPRNPPDIRIGRRTHGDMLKRLARAHVRPAAVAFDISFQPDSPWDTEMIEGIQSISGIPVIGATAGNPDDGQPGSLIAPNLRKHLLHGGVMAQASEESPWIVKLATTPPAGGVYASLPLMTAAQCWKPGAVPTLQWMPDAVVLTYGNAGSAAAREVAVTSVSEQPYDELKFGLRKGTPYAEFMIEVPNDADLASSSIDYRDLFELSDEQLRERLDGQVLFIGDFREKADGPYKHPDGRWLPGTVAVAVATERLLSGDILRRPPYIRALGAYVTSAVPITLLASLIGGLVARRLVSRGWPTRAGAFAVLAAAFIAIAVLSFRVGGFVYSPLAPILCLVMGGLTVTMICRARESTV